MMTKTCSKPPLGSRCGRGTDVSRCFTRPEIVHYVDIGSLFLSHREATLHRAPTEPHCDLRINQTDHAEQPYIALHHSHRTGNVSASGCNEGERQVATAPEHGAAAPRCNGEPPVLPSPFRRSRRLTLTLHAPQEPDPQQFTLVGRPVRAGQQARNGPAMPHIARDDRRSDHHSGGADSAHLVANSAPSNMSFMMPPGSDIL